MTTTRIAIHFPAWPPYIDPKKRSRSYRLPLTIGTLFFWTFFGPPSIRPAAALAAGAGGPGEADSCLWYKLLCVDKTNDYDDILWYACKSMYSIYIVYCILYSIYTCTKIHMLLYIYTHIITYLYLNNIYIYIRCNPLIPNFAVAASSYPLSRQTNQRSKLNPFFWLSWYSLRIPIPLERSKKGGQHFNHSASKS